MQKGSILKMFGRSPLSPLQKHISTVHDCAENLLPFFEAVLADDWEKATKYQAEIVTLEQEADAMKQDIRLHLPKGLFLPVSRSDLLELLSAQDRIANKAKDIAGLILGRKMHIPSEIAPQVLQLLKRSIDASHQAAKAINELDELLETSFRGSEANIVQDMIKKLSDIEHDTDNLQREVRYSLFQIEKDMHPIDVIFLYKIIEWLGDLADRAQHVGGRLQLLIAR